MKRIHIVLSLFFLLCGGFSFGQIGSGTSSHFEVEKETFDITDREMINALIGSKPMPLMAKDMEEKERYLGPPFGRGQIFWFFEATDPNSILFVEKLNNIAVAFQNELQVLGIGNEDKEIIQGKMADLNPLFPIIPNGKFVGEAAYNSSLGTPRIFMLDKQGKIVEIIPASYLRNTSVDLTPFVLEFLNQISH